MECCLVFFAFFVVVIFALAITVAIEQKRAREAYLESLEQLKRDPHNPELREVTLDLARKYALQRPFHKQSGGTFDEVALMNDINAACARAGTKVTIEEDHRQPSVEERLTKLESLRSKQMISEQEYESRRRQILDEL